MGRPKRLYPLGRYRLHVMGEIDPAKQYLVQLDYTWNRQVRPFQAKWYRPAASEQTGRSCAQ